MNIKDLDTELLGAIARGWCSKKNSSKVMDGDLAVAIAKEVQTYISQSNQEIVKGKTNYHIYRNGDMVHIEHSKTDSSGIGFSVNQLDGIIQKLTQLKLLVKNKE